MKRIVMFVMAAALCACGGKKTFTMKGNIESPEVVILKTIGHAFELALEPGTITVSQGEQYIKATGNPANDAETAFNEAMSELIKEFQSLGEEATEEQREALIKRNKTKRKEAKLNTKIGKPYIEVVLPDVDGNMVALSSLVGEGKWILIDFWATWCGPCCHEIPYLRDAYAKYHEKGFEIYCVSLDRDREKWAAFLPENGMTWVNVLGVDENGKRPASDSYGLQYIPMNFLISPEGKIVATGLRGEAIDTTLAEHIK